MEGRPQRRNRRSVLKIATYSRGDHLRVGRLPIAGRFLYYHHGIYVGDDRVAQFGGQLWNKPRSGIDEVPLELFSKRGVPEILDHTNLRFPGGMPLPPRTRPNGSLRGRAALSRPSLEVCTTYSAATARRSRSGASAARPRACNGSGSRWHGPGIGLIKASCSLCGRDAALHHGKSAKLWPEPRSDLHCCGCTTDTRSASIVPHELATTADSAARHQRRARPSATDSVSTENRPPRAIREAIGRRLAPCRRDGAAESSGASRSVCPCDNAAGRLLRNRDCHELGVCVPGRALRALAGRRMRRYRQRGRACV